MAAFESLYWRICRSPILWFEVSKFSLIRCEEIYKAVEKVLLIRDRLITAQSRQNIYADNRKRDLDSMIGDLVYSKISQRRGAMICGY